MSLRVAYPLELGEQLQGLSNPELPTLDYNRIRVLSFDSKL